MCYDQWILAYYLLTGMNALAASCRTLETFQVPVIFTLVVEKSLVLNVIAWFMLKNLPRSWCIPIYVVSIGNTMKIQGTWKTANIFISRLTQFNAIYHVILPIYRIRSSFQYSIYESSTTNRGK
jgi:hypothetical protein